MSASSHVGIPSCISTRAFDLVVGSRFVSRRKMFLIMGFSGSALEVGAGDELKPNADIPAPAPKLERPPGVLKAARPDPPDEDAKDLACALLAPFDCRFDIVHD